MSFFPEDKKPAKETATGDYVSTASRGTPTMFGPAGHPSAPVPVVRPMPMSYDPDAATPAEKISNQHDDPKYHRGGKGATAGGSAASRAHEQMFGPAKQNFSKTTGCATGGGGFADPDPQFNSFSGSPALPSIAPPGTTIINKFHAGGSIHPLGAPAVAPHPDNVPVGPMASAPGHIRPPMTMHYGTNMHVTNTGAPYSSQHRLAPTAPRAFAFTSDSAPKLHMSIIAHAKIAAPGVAIEPPSAGPSIIPPDRELPRYEGSDTLVNDATTLIANQKSVALHQWHHDAREPEEDALGPPPPVLAMNVPVNPLIMPQKKRKEHRTLASEVTKRDKETFLDHLSPKEAHTSIKRPIVSFPVTIPVIKMHIQHAESTPMYCETAHKNKVFTNFNPYIPEGQTQLLHLMSTHGMTGIIGDLNLENFRLVDEHWCNQVRFQIEFDVATVRCLSKGIYGAVLAAQHRLDGNWYAVKTHMMTDAWEGKAVDIPRARALSLREIWALAGIREAHPHINRYYGSWMQYDCMYIQLGFCNCGALDGILWRFGNDLNGPPGYFLNLMRLGQLTAEMLSALSFIHSHNMVHMDVKPANILVHIVGAELPPFVQVEKRMETLEEILTISPFAHSNTKPISRVVFKLADFGRCRQATVHDDIDSGDLKYMPPDGINVSEHKNLQKVDMFCLGISIAEAGGAHIPGVDSEEPSRKSIFEEGELPVVPALETADEFCDTMKELVGQMISASPDDRPEAHAVLTKPGIVEYFDDKAKMEAHVPAHNDGNTNMVNHAEEPGTPFIQPRIAGATGIHFDYEEQSPNK